MTRVTSLGGTNSTRRQAAHQKKVVARNRAQGEAAKANSVHNANRSSLTDAQVQRHPAFWTFVNKQTGMTLRGAMDAFRQQGASTGANEAEAAASLSTKKVEPLATDAE